MNEDELKLLHTDGNYNNKKGESKCDEVLVFFCLDLAGALKDPDLMKEMIIFLCMIRRAYSSYGRRLKSNFDGEEEESDQHEGSVDFCQENDISYLPRLANIFIMEIFPSYFGELKEKHKLRYLGVTSNKIINTLFLMKFLCHWLFMNRYTELRLDIDPGNKLI